MNVRSLPKHIDELELYLDSLDFNWSIIGLSETRLDDSKQDLYNLQNYTSIHAFRNGRSGGGVSMFIKNNAQFKRRFDLQFFYSEMESIFIEIDSSVYCTKSNIVVGLIYRMPDSSVEVFNERIDGVLNTIKREKKIVYLMGDLNINFLKCDNHKLTSDFIELIYSYGVFPLICKPTRVTKDTATLIDHILTNNFDVESHHNQGILCSSISDHFTVFHIAGNKMGVDTTDQSRPVLQRNFSQRNINRFINEMNNVDWKPTLDLNELEAAYNNFQMKLTNLYNICFPLTKVKKRYYTKKPWLTSGLKESIKVKNKKYVNRHNGPNPAQQEIDYKRFKNRLNHLLRLSERKYLSELIMKHKSNMKKTWQIMKGVINKNKYKPSCNKFNYNGRIIDDGKRIADRFNNFFVNVGANLASKIPVVETRPADYMKNINIANVFNASVVSEEEIYKIISNFKDSAAGWDGIKPSIIKHVKNTVKQPLAHISNLSFTTGRFPNDLKIANVIPIYKANDEMEFSNYRPVSILPVFSKLLERLMYNRLIKYINDNNLLHKNQFGFQKNKSTSMALMMLIDKISEALDKGEVVIGVFLDFSKAFDTVTMIY